MTNKVYFIADPSDDWAAVCNSWADAQAELFDRGCDDEFLFVADAVEVDAMDASVSVALVNADECGWFIQANQFDTFEDFAEEVAYRLDEFTDYYGLDAHAYALSNVERYEVVKSLARC